MIRRPVTSKAVFLLAFCACLATNASAQVTPGQIDSFTDGGTSGWQIGPLGAGSVWEPTVSADGGPEGAGDAYLVARSSGLGGAGSKLVIYNEAQWTGDYTAAMVSHVTMDVQNLGSESVMLRLYVESSGGGDWISADSVLLESSSGWQNVSFALAEGALVGGTNYQAAMQSVDRFRIMHATDRLFPPVAVEATIGIDNITAVPIDTAVEDVPARAGNRIISVYPNPTADEVVVAVASGKIEVSVYDLLGRRIADWSDQLPSGAGSASGVGGGTIQIRGSLSGVPTGLYFIRVADAYGVDTRSIVVAR